MMPIKQQRGSTLLVALIMLVLLTLIALSAIDSTTSSVQMVGNAQFREEAIAAAQTALEFVASSNDFQSSTPPVQYIDVNGDPATKEFTVSFAKPACLAYEPVVVGAKGVPSSCASSSTIGPICYWTIWDVRAEVSDASTGASVVLHQGVNALSNWQVAMNNCI